MNDQLAGAPTPATAPVSGAWFPGDEPGDRRFAQVVSDRPFRLECGAVLSEVTLAYETWGTLAPDGSNALLVCHALTGDSHAAGRAKPGHPEPGWWDGLIGPGRGIDTDRWFVVCSNVLGGCQGSTGPASLDPSTGRPYGASFPVVTIRDMVRAQALLADHLGIERWHTVVGGSMGGMQALEWAVMFPARLRALVCIASSAAASAQQIAWSQAGRLAVEQDPNFNGGNYYDAEPGGGPHLGLGLARRIALIHYRTEVAFAQRFGRTQVDAGEGLSLHQAFDVERYLDYHAHKLIHRFDANSYVRLNKAMDLHDLGRGRGGVTAALARIRVPTLIGSIDSDDLYPPYQQRELVNGLRAAGLRVGAFDIHSIDGHDAFLIDVNQFSPVVAGFLDGADEFFEIP